MSLWPNLTKKSAQSLSDPSSHWVGISLTCCSFLRGHQMVPLLCIFRRTSQVYWKWSVKGASLFFSVINDSCSAPHPQHFVIVERKRETSRFSCRQYPLCHAKVEPGVAWMLPKGFFQLGTSLVYPTTEVLNFSNFMAYWTRFILVLMDPKQHESF